MEFIYRANDLKIAPRKLRMVVDKVRHMPVDRALGVLPLIPNKGAQLTAKALAAAVASAVRDQDQQREQLVIQRVWVDEARPLKRMMMHSRGRSAMIMKKSSHLVLVLAPAAEKAVAKQTK